MVFKMNFINRNESTTRAGRKMVNFDRKHRFDLSTLELRSGVLLSNRFRPSIYDANESNEKLFRRRCKWGARGYNATDALVGGLMEKRFGSSAARDNWS